MPNDHGEALSELTPRLLASLKSLHVSVLASALVVAANRPHSIAEILELRRDLEHALSPSPNNKDFVEWARTGKDRLNRVRT
ncbi:MAG: hypothetical protein ABI306_00325 [Caulobacteraceae bacterium]